MNNPGCQTELAIVSADTLVENPLLAAHVSKLKDAVESMGKDVPFIIVKPAIEDTYMVSILGRGVLFSTFYLPPCSSADLKF